MKCGVEENVRGQGLGSYVLLGCHHNINENWLLFSEPPAVMPLTFGRDTLDEGDFAQVICIISKGDEPLTISWSLQGAVVSAEAGITTNQLGPRTSMLTIQSVGYRHNGFYTCTAKNRAGSSSVVTELKVNG